MSGNDNNASSSGSISVSSSTAGGGSKVSASSTVSLNSSSVATGGKLPLELLKHDELLLGRSVEMEQLRGMVTVNNKEVQQQQENGDVKEQKVPPKIAFVHGSSGTGKSYLVEHFLADKQLSSDTDTTFVLRGKFDQQVSADPFSVLAAAVSKFCKQLLESTQSLEKVRSHLMGVEGLQDHDSALFEAIPALHIIMKQGDSSDTTAESGDKETAPGNANAEHPQNMQQSSHQLRYQFMLFLEAICTALPDTKIVLFLDDLQWADETSLELLAMILTDTKLASKNFLFLGAYRDNEVDAVNQRSNDGHLLTQQVLSVLTDNKIDFLSLPISNLSKDATKEYIATILQVDDNDKVSDLATAIYGKTRGNMFHTKMALSVLEQRNILHYSYMSGKWEWDLVRLEKEMVVSKNVVETSIARLQGLSQELQIFLRTASFLKSSFDVETLLELLPTTTTEDDDDLEESMQGKGTLPSTLSTIKGLEKLCDKAVSRGLLEKVTELGVLGTQRYRFVHDRIREAANSFPDDADREEEKFRIGQLLVELASGLSGEDWMFFAGVDHLNSVRDIQFKFECLRLVELNHQAASMSSTRSDFYSASNYLDMATRLLSNIPSPWEQHYNLCLGIFNMATKVFVCVGRFERAQQCADQIFAHAQTPRDKVEAYVCLGEGLGAQARHEDALALYKEALEILPGSLPKRFLLPKALSDTKKIKQAFAKLSDEEILSMPTLQDTSSMILSIKIINEMVVRAYMARETGLSLICMTRAVLLTLKHGLSGPGCVAFVHYGAILAGPLKDLKLGMRLGKLSMAMMQRTLSREFETKVLFNVSVQIDGWIQPLRQVQETLIHAYQVGMETGDTEFAFYSAVNYQIHSFMLGIPLGPILDEMAHFVNRVEQFANDAVAQFARPLQSMWMCLAGRRDPFVWMDTIEHSLIEAKSVGPSEKLGMIWTLISKGILAYRFGRYDAAEKCWNVMLPLAAGAFSYFTPLLIIYHHGLISSARFRQTHRRKYKRQAKKCLREMKDLVEKHSSGLNGLHCYHIMKADCTSSFGSSSDEDVKHEFDQAISFAARAGFSHDAALANELCGSYFARKGDNFWGKHYLTTAYEQYIRWEGFAKAESLLKSNERYIDVSSSAETSSRSRSSTSSRVSVLSKLQTKSCRSGSMYKKDGSSSLLMAVEESPSSERQPSWRESSSTIHEPLSSS